MVLQDAVAEPAKHLMQRRVWKACSPKVYACKKLSFNSLISLEKFFSAHACADRSSFTVIPPIMRQPGNIAMLTLFGHARPYGSSFHAA
jgi:hypothetical protein